MGEIRDPVHGLIELNNIEAKLIDTQPFQRLRRIQQLALAHLGFHGAHHSRFEHCIGVMHVAGKIIEHLRSNESCRISQEVEQDIRCAALLHDVGHGPFSHIAEYIMQQVRSDKDSKDKTEDIHEEISRRIIRDNKEILKVLGKERAIRVSKLLQTDTGGAIGFPHDVVSGPIDADKMDYLLRDSYYSGVKYGVFDLERLINVLGVTRKEKRLGIVSEGVEAAEQYVLAKYFITRQVYQHKIRMVTDVMLIEGMRNAIRLGNSKMQSLFTYKATIAFVDNYLKYDDYETGRVVRDFENRKRLKQRYFNMLHNRELLKVLYCGSLKELRGRITFTKQKLDILQKTDANDLKEEIAKATGLDKDWIHIKAFSVKAPLAQKSEDLFEEDTVPVISKHGVTTLGDKSVLLNTLISDAGTNLVAVFGKPPQVGPTLKQIETKVKKALYEFLGDL